MGPLATTPVKTEGHIKAALISLELSANVWPTSEIGSWAIGTNRKATSSARKERSREFGKISSQLKSPTVVDKLVRNRGRLLGPLGPRA